MALPQRVQADLDQAEAMLAQLQSPPAQVDTDASEAAPVVTDDAPPADTPDDGTPPAPEPTPAPAPAPVAAPTTPQTPEATWEHKYKTLQGMHNRNMEAFRQRAEALEAQVASLSQQLEAARKPSTPPAPPEDTTKDAEVFGTDLVDMVKRVVNSAFGGLAQQFNERLSAVESHLQGTTQVVARTAEDQFLARLSAQVPDYEQVNQDADFLAWLAEVDPIYGLPRQAALTAAADARDANRVAGIFLAFKATQTPPPAPTPVPTPAASLERQVAPRAGASAPAAPSTKPVYTSAQVDAFYRDVRRGVYRGREADAQRIEDQFNEALAEGRIVA